jgi:hypothetical protein
VNKKFYDKENKNPKQENVAPKRGIQGRKEAIPDCHSMGRK